MKFINFIKKYPKDTLITLAIIIAIVTAVLAWDWSDNAKTPFWANTWVVVGIIAIAACIGGWLYLNSKTPRQ